MSIFDAWHPLKLARQDAEIVRFKQSGRAKTHAADAEGREEAGYRDSSARQCLPYTVRVSCSNICVAIS